MSVGLITDCKNDINKHASAERSCSWKNHISARNILQILKKKETNKKTPLTFERTFKNIPGPLTEPISSHLCAAAH